MKAVYAVRPVELPVGWPPGAQAAWLPPGRSGAMRRLHLQHGPIDLIITAEGPGAAQAYQAAVTRFAPLLATLAAELPGLRAPSRAATRFTCPIAQSMLRTTVPHAQAGTFVTPMAAVAGAVADAVLAAMIAAAPDLTRAAVNNGGDIALHLGPGAAMRIGLVADLRDGRLAGTLTLSHGDPPHPDPPRGVATSGRHGRSLSLGIADAVTVLAACAAAADVAATLIANAVDLPGDPAISRTPANEIDPDSDLGARLVTTDVGPLDPARIDAALARGADTAYGMQRQGLIHSAHLALAGHTRTVTPALELAHA